METLNNYSFNPHVKGNTYRGTEFTIQVAGVAVNLTGCDIVMHLRLQPTHPTKYELSITSGHISITDAAAGKFTLNEVKIDFPAGNYYYDCQITFPDESVKTFFGGRFPIIQNITV